MNARNIIAIASTAVLITAGISSAQNLVDRSGATDANRRLGSNGRNSVSNRPNPWDVSNAIVYGNVTGGKEFRGGSQSTDPAAFRNGTGSAVQDNFVRDSSGVTTNGVSSFNASQTRSYYGDARAVPPPPGYVGISSTGGYTPPTPLQWRTFDPRQQPLGGPPQLNDLSGTINDPGVATFAYNANGLPVVPALGAQQLNPAALSDYTNLNQNNLSSQLTTDQLTRLRQEIGQGDAVQDNGAQPGNLTPGAVDNTTPQSSITGTRLDDRLQAGSLNKPALDNSLQSQQVPEAGLVTRLATSPDQSAAGDQSNASGQTGLARPGQAAADAANEFNTQMRARKAAEEKAKNKTDNKTDQNAPSTPGATKLPGDKSSADMVGKPDANMKVAPVTLEAIAGSSKTKGLSDLLTKAEAQMRDGKFASAIDTYDAAESVAPRNALIKLGLVNAELGGSFYRRAEATLRQIAPADQHVLAGQYDLRSFIGDERLQLAQKDLSDLVQKNPNDVGAAVLLAYLYYNTANERRAVALLDLADKRAGGNDPLVTFLKKNWNSPAESK